jgi:hypothetical protein
MSLSTTQKMVEALGIADVALQQAAADHDRQVKQASAVQQLIPACVDALVEHGRINPEQREKVAAALRDPAQAISLLTKLAAHRSSVERETLGRGVKSASANSSVKQSDRALFAGLGLPVPTE